MIVWSLKAKQRGTGSLETGTYGTSVGSYLVVFFARHMYIRTSVHVQHDVMLISVVAEQRLVDGQSEMNSVTELHPHVAEQVRVRQLCERQPVDRLVDEQLKPMMLCN